MCTPRSSSIRLSHILFAHFRHLFLVLHLLFFAKKCGVYIVDQLSMCIPFLYRRVIISPTTYLQMENTGTMAVVKSSVSEGSAVSSNIYTVCRWIDGRNSRLAKRICCSPTRSLLSRSSCCISPPLTGSRESSIPGEKYKAQERGTGVADVVS